MSFSRSSRETPSALLGNLGVEHQAQNAVALFWQAARTEAATLELVERAIDALRRARPVRRGGRE